MRRLKQNDEPDRLREAAADVESDGNLMAEMAEWEEATVADGLDEDGVDSPGENPALPC